MPPVFCISSWVMSQAAAQQLRGHAAGLEVLQARKAAWQEAFLSLKAAVRSSACDCFYILSPEVRLALVAHKQVMQIRPLSARAPG